MIFQEISQHLISPVRIVSLVPSITELLFDLGLRDEVTGITKFCIHPQEWFKTKTRIGGTKTVKINIIDELLPDLIIANKEENEKEQVDKLATRYNVWLTEVKTIADALMMIIEIGQLTGKKVQAEKMTASIFKRFSHLNPLCPSIKTTYFIWRNPYIVAGGDTFISDVMLRCGFENCFKKVNRYPIVASQDLIDKQCRLILLSSEPFPFKEKHLAEVNHFFPGIPVKLVNGEMFSWYGSRLLMATSYFEGLIKSIPGN